MLKNFLSIYFATMMVALADPASGRPNVLVFLTDDQGWGDLSIHGNDNLKTPNIDDLANSGARFEKFYVCPVCSPTRAEFLTGRYHPRGGVYSTSAGGERLDLDEHTIAQTFKAAGYATGAFGKWHNGMQYPYHPNGRGFDEYYGFCSGHWAHYFDPMLEHNGRIVKGEGFVIDDFTGKAMEFIESSAKAGKPFFAYLPYNTPHSPMQVPDEYWQRFSGKELAQRSRQADRENIEHTRAALAMCENIDWNVGRLLGKLDALGITQDTIVVFFHDNGPNGWRWNAGLRGKKGSTDEGGVRSPLFVRWPRKIKPGTRVNQVSAAIDLLPTLAGLAGIDVSGKKPLDGRSLKPLLLGGGKSWPSRTIFSHWKGRVSARSERFRLDHAERLYDMIADPGQRRDVTGQNPAVARHLQAEVMRFRKDVVSEMGEDRRPFLLGHPGLAFTQVPARDGIAHGGIKRSNKFPNCSHFWNWRNLDDRITWDVEVVEGGDFDVEIYYTCPEADVGSSVELSFNGSTLKGLINEAFDPPYIGRAADRFKRNEGDEKEWKSLSMGTMRLEKGSGILTLRALEIPGDLVMDFRLLMFKRKSA
ncbi:MAG: arylsulfatase [Verrucomicrobiaceae bacterium]|nr:arylsulfatase [Verrucomicrobiaceae bacterium]